MAHVLIVTAGRTGLRNQCVELIRRLERAGHQATLAAPGTVAEVLERDGVPFLSVVAPPSEMAAPPSSDAVSRSRARRWWDRITTAAKRRDEAVDRLIHPGYESAVRKLGPDLILVDVELQAYAVASYGLSPRLAILNPFLSPRHRAGVPPLHTSIQPGTGLRGSWFGIEWAWMQYRAWKAWKHGIDWLRRPGSNRVAVIRRLAEQVGFPHRKELALYEWLFPFSFKTIPTLNTNAIELDFPHSPHPSERYVGPLIRLDRGDRSAELDVHTRQALDRLFARRTPERKLVYCGFGTAFSGNDADFLRRLVGAVSEHPEWDVVVALGGRSKSPEIGVLPTHVHVFEWVPQLEVLEHADCAVIHAGNSSLYECLHFEVPMVLFPFRVNDQIGNAARAAFHGLGILGDRDADPPARIAAHISKALDPDGVRDAARSMKARLQRYDDENTAVEIVEALLAEPATHPGMRLP